MKVSKLACLAFSILVSGNVLAADDHDHDHGEELEEYGVVLEGNYCVVRLREVEAGKEDKFDSMQMELAVDAAACSECLKQELPEEICLDDKNREKALAGIVEMPEEPKPGLHGGAKIVFKVIEEDKEKMVNYFCHFHTEKREKIDCHT